MSHGQPVDFFELEQQRLGSLANSMVLTIAEGFGDIVDTREWQNDDPTFGYGRVGQPILYTTLNDRDDGKYLPIYQSQMDLAAIRAEARNVTAMSGGVMGAIGTLTNYTLGAGLKFTAQQAPACPVSISPEVLQSLIVEAQAVIDQFLRENNFQSDMDREIDARAREDGEAFIELCVSPMGQIRASFDEPDMVCQPSDSRSIEVWLQDTDPLRYSSEWIWSWSFGVHCVRKTPDDPQGYHVVYDTTGSDWDYIPASRMLHVKRNVPRNVKRGVSDLYWIANDVQREAKIRRNTAAGAALQAAIAWVREHATGITPTAVSNMVTGNAVTTRQQRTSSGTQLRPGGKLREGTVVDIPENMKYLPGPMGSERNPNFILVAQYVSRAIAQRWAMPEFMFTSDASNANYASTLVAESPFTKARETDQRFYSQRFVELMWKVLRLAHEIGRSFRQLSRFDDLMQILEITAEGPRVSNRDELQMVQRQEIQMRLGLLSEDTAAAEGGLDIAKERAKGAKPQAQSGVAPSQPGVTDNASPPPVASGEMLGQTMTERQRYMKNVLAIIDKLQAGMDPETARVMLDAQGVPPAKVQGILDRAAAGATDQEIVSDIGDQQTVTEEADIEVVLRQRASRDFPKNVPTQEQILNESAKRLDELFDDLAAKTASGARKAELVEILKEIEDVKGQAALAAQVCGMLTPFKPTLQDGQSATESPVEPLAAVATEVKE